MSKQTVRTPWSELTPRERDALIAERFGGWAEGTLRTYQEQVTECGEGETAFDTDGMLPHYTTDRAACQPILEEIARQELDFGYVLALAVICKLSMWERQDQAETGISPIEVFELMLATPDQLCEAAVQVLEAK